MQSNGAFVHRFTHFVVIFKDINKKVFAIAPVVELGRTLETFSLNTGAVLSRALYTVVEQLARENIAFLVEVLFVVLVSNEGVAVATFDHAAFGFPSFSHGRTFPLFWGKVRELLSMVAHKFLDLFLEFPEAFVYGENKASE